MAGYDAERFFLTMEAAAKAAPEGSTQREEAGTLVVLTDMWTSRGVPAFQARSAFEDGWGKLPASERAKYLFRIARIIQERSRELAVL